ncbi:MAG: TonB-dependent receptor [Gemmatimonadaceae bacterium]|nr:TonB-dependent receptor [Gemmatimonadaceae bacterium]
MISHKFRLQRFVRTFSLVVLGLVALTAASVSAQNTTGTVRGTVTSSGATVADAQIQLRNPATGVQRGTTSREDGSFTLAGLPPASYEMTVRRIGSTPQTRVVVVQIGATQIQNFAISDQAAQLEAVVVSAAAAIETRTSESATNVTQAQIEKLPTPSRNFLDLAQLSPGVTVTEDRVNGQFRTVSAGGQAPSAVNLFIDGTSFKNDLTQGGIAGQDASRGSPFPRNAVQEYRVISQNFKAEYQKASSAVITATTKSGGNTWSGNALVGYQNASLVLLDSFQRADKVNNPRTFKKPDYNRTLGAFSLGGPIVKDKIHIFGSYEGNYQNRSNRVAIPAPPTGFPALDTVNLTQYNGNFGSPFRETLLFGKLTDQINDKSSAELSVSHRNETDIRDFGGNAAFETANNVHNYNTVAQLKHNFFTGPWLNEALLSYTRFHRGFSPNTEGKAHRLYIFPGACCFEIGSGRSTQEYIQKGPRFRNDLTYTGLQLGGEHVIKGGFNLDFPTYDVDKNNDGTPVFEYQNIRNTGFGDQVYNYANPFQLRYGTGDPKVNASNKQIGLYLQDDWSPVKRLTLNLGIRWDYETNMLNTDYVTPQAAADTLRKYASNLVRPLDLDRYIATGNNRNPFKGAFQPRVGFSYSVDEAARTTFFGGWGLYYDRIPFDVALDEKLKISHPTFFTLFAPRGTAPRGTQIPWLDSYLTADKATLDAVSRASGRPELWLIDNEFKIPHSTQYSLGIRQLFGQFSTSVSYAGQRGTDLFTLNLANVKLNPGGGCCSVPFDFGSRGYSNIIYSSNEAKTWYDALNVQLDRPYSRPSLDQFGWGAGLAFTYAKRSLQGIDNQGDTFAFPSASEIPKHASNDEKTRVVANWIADIPHLFGIQWSGLATLGGKYRLDAGCSRFCSSSDVAGNPILVGGFEVPGSFPYRNVDTRIRKDFPNFGRSQMAFGVTLDVFNAFNRDNFGCFNVGNPKDKNFGNPGCVSTDARRYQLGAEYNF